MIMSFVYIIHDIQMLFWIITTNFSGAEKVQVGVPPLIAAFPTTRFTIFQSFEKSKISVRLPASNQNHLKCDSGPVFSYQGTPKEFG